MKRTLAMVCGLMVAMASVAQTENWSDSVKHYFAAARVLDSQAYLKLAECYHEGRGVEHNLPMVLAMLKGVERYGDGRATEKFFASLDAEDADRKAFKGLMKLDESGIDDYDVVITIAKRGGELMERMIQVAWLQREGKDDEAVMLLKELAERIPACYDKLGSYYKERDPQKALEYYRLADKWACLGSTGAEMLLEDEYKKEEQTHQRNKNEVNRLRLIKDGIGG